MKKVFTSILEFSTFWKSPTTNDGLSKSNWIVDFDISKIDFSRFTLGSGNRWKGLFRKLLSALVVVETVGKRKEHVTKYHSMAWSIPSEFRQEKGEGAIKADRTIWGDFDAWESLFASELWQTTTETRVEMWWNLLLTVSELLCHHPQALWGHYKLQGLRPQQHCHQPLQQSAPRNNVMGILVCFAMFWNGIQKVSLLLVKMKCNVAKQYQTVLCSRNFFDQIFLPIFSVK